MIVSVVPKVGEEVAAAEGSRSRRAAPVASAAAGKAAKAATKAARSQGSAAAKDAEEEVSSSQRPAVTAPLRRAALSLGRTR